MFWPLTILTFAVFLAGPFALGLIYWLYRQLRAVRAEQERLRLRLEALERAAGVGDDTGGERPPA